MNYVYFLWSQKLDKIYIGETADIIKRLKYHNKGTQRYTKKGTPWRLIGYIPFSNRREALKEEKRLKKSKNREYYKKYLLKYGKKLINESQG
ncbi:MAG: GIY-YIG nuclease family protein [Candidatus Magasanikbacteria bacterium]|jgi:putative endonuclease|nr:GIY-YIG nuclease family protein [Candidatus Magasanikbacteria bacterium]MBT4546765.1 GIY-YIG nuclease family protein [Candidatus Magasanikbacteria bacterium]MBT6819626.1 GIY-YIG nuclease family protein [Candidatus Magasanikbacteria bacterium]